MKIENLLFLAKEKMFNTIFLIPHVLGWDLNIVYTVYTYFIDSCLDFVVVLNAFGRLSRSAFFLTFEEKKTFL